jgi:hypothetical protein
LKKDDDDENWGTLSCKKYEQEEKKEIWQKMLHPFVVIWLLSQLSVYSKEDRIKYLLFPFAPFSLSPQLCNVHDENEIIFKSMKSLGDDFVGIFFFEKDFHQICFGKFHSNSTWL